MPDLVQEDWGSYPPYNFGKIPTEIHQVILRVVQSKQVPDASLKKPSEAINSSQFIYVVMSYALILKVAEPVKSRRRYVRPR